VLHHLPFQVRVPLYISPSYFHSLYIHYIRFQNKSQDVFETNLKLILYPISSLFSSLLA